MPAETIYDAAIVGGSFAGLAAATYLARARRRVLVVDAGEPRNRFAAASHGFLGRDGHAPAAMLAEAGAQLLAYPTARIERDRVVGAARNGDTFVASLASGLEVRARRLVLANGIVDVLPDVPGIRERWGRSVLHCPYCHGYEVADARLGVLASTPISVHHALLTAEWGPVTFFTNGLPIIDADAAASLAARGVIIDHEPVDGLEGASPGLEAVRLASGRRVAVDALFVGTSYRLADDIAERLGCAVDAGPLGPVIRTDANKLTTVDGVYAAGDAARERHSVSWAVADGVTAGVSAHQSLVFGPHAHPASHSAAQRA